MLHVVIDMVVHSVQLRWDFDKICRSKQSGGKWRESNGKYSLGFSRYYAAAGAAWCLRSVQTPSRPSRKDETAV